MQDSIPIHRDTLEHWVYADAEYFKIWVTMLSRARYLAKPKKGIYQNISFTINRGEFLFGRKKWNEDTGVSEQKLRTLIKKLIKENMIVNVATTSKFTIYLIVNYEKFNQHNNQQQTQEIQGVEGVEQPEQQPESNQHLTSSQPASNQQLTTNKESNKKEKKAKTVNNNLYTADFEYFYAAYPRPENKTQSFTNWKTQLKNGVASDDLIQAANNYAMKCRAEKKDKKYCYSSSNFLGKANYVEDYLPGNFNPVTVMEQPAKKAYQQPGGQDMIERVRAKYAAEQREAERLEHGQYAKEENGDIRDCDTIDISFSKLESE